VSEGDYVSVGNRVFTISPLTAYRVSLGFPQSLRGVLDLGQTVRLYPADDPEERAEGTITRIRPSVDGGSRSLVAVVDFDDPGGWRPGMTVTGEVVIDSRTDAVRIPRIAIIQRPAGQVVYVVNGDEVRQREISLGHQTREWAEVTSGLTAGETIVTDGAQFLTDGAPIRLREEDA
jgi:RND family efflux transporter MFP subunit